jgi:hypothetical protein
LKSTPLGADASDVPTPDMAYLVNLVLAICYS